MCLLPRNNRIVPAAQPQVTIATTTATTATAATPHFQNEDPSKQANPQSKSPGHKHPQLKLNVTSQTPNARIQALLVKSHRMDLNLIANSSNVVHKEDGQRVLSLDEEDMEAINEHRSLRRVPLSISPADIIILLGRGNGFYFQFCKYLCWINVILTCVACIDFIPHMITALSDNTKPGLPEILYLSSYDRSTRLLWTIASILSTVLIFFAGSIYRRYVRWYMDKREKCDSTFVEDPFEGQYGIDIETCVDKIPYKNEPTRKQQLLGRSLSVFTFTIVLVGQGVVNYFLEQQLKNSGSGNAAILIALVVVLLNYFWKFLCQHLTKLEMHIFYSNYRRWDVIKIFTFKLCNVLVLYFVKSYQISEAEGCTLSPMAEQFVLLLLVDLTVSNLVEIGVPLIQRWLCDHHAEKTDAANDESKPEFDLAEEYLELVYRQFVTGLGLLVFPLFPFFTLICNVVEYWLDKYRMLRIMQKPKRTKTTFKDILQLFFILSGVAISCGYPNGAIWILTGSAGVSSHGNCSVYQ